MDIDKAIEFVNDGFYFWPEWKFYAERGWGDGSICVRLSLESRDTSYENAKKGYTAPFGTHGRYTIPDVSAMTFEEFRDKIFGLCAGMLIHEASEAFRMKDTGEAPYHAHKPGIGGTRNPNWARALNGGAKKVVETLATTISI